MYNQPHKEMIITIKLRFWNLFLITIGFGIALIVGFYVTHESTSEKVVHKTEHLQQLEKLK